MDSVLVVNAGSPRHRARGNAARNKVGLAPLLPLGRRTSSVKPSHLFGQITIFDFEVLSDFQRTLYRARDPRPVQVGGGVRFPHLHHAENQRHTATLQ